VSTSSSSFACNFLRTSVSAFGSKGRPFLSSEKKNVGGGGEEIYFGDCILGGKEGGGLIEGKLK
jgi:hypothetical protein